jgi:hypothetical protein
MKFTKKTLKKAARTFLQTAIGYATANVAFVDFTAGKKVVISALIGLLTSAVAAGVAAAMNLEKKGSAE